MPADGDRMSSSGLTDQQQRAVTARGTSVALSAGAGCGKTFVLTERFLAELEPDGRARAGRVLSQLVAITFTERAAREMRDRIRKACRAACWNVPNIRRTIGSNWSAIWTRRGSARSMPSAASLLRAHAVEARHRPAVPRARRRPGRHAAVRVDRRHAPRPAGRAR